MYRTIVSKTVRQVAATRTASFHTTRPVFSAEHPETKPRISPEVQAVVDQVMKLNILQTIELVNELKSAFGYSDASFMAAAPAAAAPAPAAGAAAAAPAEEVAAAPAQTSFSVKLESYDATAKVKVIKEVRAASGLGLKEAKELVEGAPKIVKKDLSKDDADKLVAILKEAGAVCVIE